MKTYSFCWPGKQNWVAFCQGKVEGGFRGRTNKLVDGCYSFWQVCPSHFSCSRWKRLFNLLDLYWRFVPWPQKSRELHWTILAGPVTMASKIFHLKRFSNVEMCRGVYSQYYSKLCLSSTGNKWHTILLYVQHKPSLLWTYHWILVNTSYMHLSTTHFGPISNVTLT